jgi:prefoldin subunit 5
MESRIKKLEDKINEFEEQQEELDSNIEDLYNTINEFKYIRLMDLYYEEGPRGVVPIGFLAQVAIFKV